MPQKDPEARREYMRQWKATNREKLREKQREYQKQNVTKRKEYAQRYYRENREKILKRESERYWSDPEVRQTKSQRAREWAEKNPQKIRENQRRSWAKQKYGLTLEEYDEILARGCAICGTHEGRVVGKRNGQEPPPARLCLDHDHTTGKVRDALCHNCNAALGSFADDPVRLRAAADYLESHASN